jgi:nucleoside-diphosphate kinase
MNRERTLLLIKPDAVYRGLTGKVIVRFEDKGFNLAAMKMLWMTREQAEKLYEPHVGKDFFEPTVKFMTSSPIVAIVLVGLDVIKQVRKMNGATNPVEAEAGSIRGDFATHTSRNCVHASDSKENAEREIPIFFKESEIMSYTWIMDDWA